MKKPLFFLVALFGILGQEIAHGDDASVLQASLEAAGVKCRVNSLGNVVGDFDFDEVTTTIVVDAATFSKDGAAFRSVSGGAPNRPKAADLTDEQLEWILIQNGLKKAGGTRILDADSSSILVARVPVPVSADGETIESAMYACAAVVVQAGKHIPEADSTQKTDTETGEGHALGEALDAEQCDWATSDDPWTVTMEAAFYGSSCVQSSGGGGGEVDTWMKTVVSGSAKKMTFRFQKSYYHATFSVQVDGVPVFTDNSVSSPDEIEWLMAEVPIPDGTHEVKFNYHHPGQGWANKFNGVRIDAVKFEDVPAGMPIAAQMTLPERSESRESSASDTHSSGSEAVPSPRQPASTPSVDSIITKAEAHDGIVIGGFYLGMAPDDALALCQHYFGGLGTVKLHKVVWKDYMDGGYTLEGGSVSWKSGRGPSSSKLRVEPYEGIVLVADGEYQAICSFGKKTDHGPTCIERFGGPRTVNYITFNSKMIRALIGQKKVMSLSAMGRAFFQKYDLDGDIYGNDSREFTTPEKETVFFDSETSTIHWGFDFQRNYSNGIIVDHNPMFHLQFPEGDHWW